MMASPRPDRAYSQVSSLGSGGLVSISIAKPPELGLADWMSHLRDWLDHHCIEPAGFKHNGGGSGSETYEVNFHERNEADLFAAEFSEKTPSITNLDPDPPGVIHRSVDQGSSPEPKPSPNGFMPLTKEAE